MKEKGVLLPIFSLPSKYGIGDFGYEAYEFIDILSKNNIRYWEILPINECNTHPYSPVSYYALEENYISLDKLAEQGLIKEAETRPNKDRAIYDDFKEKYCKEAFENFKPDNKFKRFIKIDEIDKYAEFAHLKKGESKEYYLFLQYILYIQWMELKQYANEKNVQIVGDMPVYPALILLKHDIILNILIWKMANSSLKLEHHQIISIKMDKSGIAQYITLKTSRKINTNI